MTVRSRAALDPIPARPGRYVPPARRPQPGRRCLSPAGPSPAPRHTPLEYAQNQLGDVVFVELPKPGDHVTAKESFGTVESVKAVSDIYSPVTGEVSAVNSRLQESPELLNADPYGEAWLIRVALEDHRELEPLMTSEQYEVFLKQEASSGTQGGAKS